MKLLNNFCTASKILSQYYILDMSSYESQSVWSSKHDVNMFFNEIFSPKNGISPRSGTWKIKEISTAIL